MAARTFLETLFDIDEFSRGWDRCLEDRGLKARPAPFEAHPFTDTPLEENPLQAISVPQEDIPEWMRRYALAGGVAGSVFSLAVIAFLIWGRG